MTILTFEIVKNIPCQLVLASAVGGCNLLLCRGMSAAASMLIVSGLAPFICDLVGVVGGPLKQQINAMNSFTRPHTMAEVATRPPTLEQSLTRNWKNASLKTRDEGGDTWLPGIPVLGHLDLQS